MFTWETPAMNRRNFLRSTAVLTAGATAGCDFSLREGILNPCGPPLPPELAAHPLVKEAWKGLDPAQVCDVHCHVYGNGDSRAGPWFNPAMERIVRPQQYVQRMFFLNAGCAIDQPGQVDASIVERLLDQCNALPPGAKVMLLAFDWSRDEAGAPVPDQSTFYVPDFYAAELARKYPQRFEWAASIHPYAPDALDRVDAAAANGALAVKWIPSAQGIDPASPRCDAFYRRLADARLPLLSHAGDERAVRGHDETLGNPLRLRRPLDAGVRVIVAHCASLGMGHDTDAAGGPMTPNFALFARLFDSPAHRDRLYGDVSALTQGNRLEVLARLIERTDWHPRLLQGSDYPLPGVLPLIPLDTLVERKMLPLEAVAPLREIRTHNVLLFDFVLKRSVRSNGVRFADAVFETRRVLARPV